jgi:hypothetical protein
VPVGLVVRSPRFEPGSSAWQAFTSAKLTQRLDVLDQTRLRPHETSLFSMEILKPTAQLKNKQTRHDLAIKVRTTD